MMDCKRFLLPDLQVRGFQPQARSEVTFCVLSDLSKTSIFLSEDPLKILPISSATSEKIALLIMATWPPTLQIPAQSRPNQG
jgi:hypothetical protein